MCARRYYLFVSYLNLFLYLTLLYSSRSDAVTYFVPILFRFPFPADSNSIHIILRLILTTVIEFKIHRKNTYV